ncbi:MAG TPA: hypothetical protein VJR06_07100 [Nitrososphaerales archaeon]|nr:hypothetical protein [Nitrososphaerales archaeon]
MRPAGGVAAELLALSAVLFSGQLLRPGLEFAAYLLLAEALSTYLTHCPAHYFVGKVLGISFSSISIGKTSLARVLPARLAGSLRRLPVLTLATKKASLASVSRRRVAAMYASGTAASTGSAFVIAAAATAAEPWPYSGIAWAVALAYLAFDLVFSPRSGDIFRARRALRGSHV